MLKVLLDSDALFALIQEDDPSHNKAVEISKKLSQAEVYLATTTLAEVLTVLGRKVGKEISLTCLRYIRESEFKSIVVDDRLVGLAEDYYDKQTSVKNTFFDCINMAVAKIYKLDAIFSFDKGYEKNGFKLLK